MKEKPIHIPGRITYLVCVDDSDECRIAIRLAALRARLLHLLHEVEALRHLAKDHVLAVQPVGLGDAQEELAAIRVLPTVGH